MTPDPAAPVLPAVPTSELLAGLPRSEDLDIRLVAVDMDGTLLDPEHRVDPTFWPLLTELRRRGVTFSPASGRQYATLAREFDRERIGPDADGMVFIAENGTYVVRDGVEVSSEVLDDDVVVRLVRGVRDLAASGANLGAVVCGKRSAHVERTDAAFHTEVDRYYKSLTEVPTLLTDDGGLAVDDEVLEVAVFDFADVSTSTVPALAALVPDHQVVVSGKHWLDVLSRDSSKGHALRAVQEALGVTPAQTVVFGDYLNDLEMLDAADLSFAMANGHPEVRERARYLAPPNTENGVVRVLARLLGVEMARLAAVDR